MDLIDKRELLNINVIIWKCILQCSIIIQVTLYNINDNNNKTNKKIFNLNGFIIF